MENKMSKPRSVETELRRTKEALRVRSLELSRSLLNSIAYRNRATIAEQEVAEWRQRFDILLRRDDAKV